MSNNIENDPSRDDIVKDAEYDQLPTVDQIMVDRGQGKILSGSGSITSATLDQADDDDVDDDPSNAQICHSNASSFNASDEIKKGDCYCYSRWNVVKAFLLAGMIISGLAVGLLVGESRNKAVSISTGRLNLTQQDLIDQEFAILGGSEFDDSNSYQSRALNVLIENGVSVDDDPNTIIGRQKLAQRYALLCLYYSTNMVRTAITDAQFGYGTTPQWNNTNVPAPWKFKWGNDECDWSGVVCDGSRLVKRIELVNHLLTGFIPMELQLLDGGPIEVLDFTDNRGLGQGGFPKVFSEFDSLGKF